MKTKCSMNGAVRNALPNDRKKMTRRISMKNSTTFWIVMA